MSFRKEILRNKLLTSGLNERGYFFAQGQMSDDNFCVFERSKELGISTEVSFNIWDKRTFNSCVSICSKDVATYYNNLNLFLEDPVSLSGGAVTVLVVDLRWLYWNIRANEARSDDKYSYKTEEGIQDFFNDFDTVGKEFILNFSSPLALANVLADINSYPKNIKLGGGLRSVDAYIYSALLYLQYGEQEKAKEVLDKGLKLYSYSEPGAIWQVQRFTQFQERRKRILSYLETHNAANIDQR